MWAMHRSSIGWECLCFLCLLSIAFCRSGKPEDLAGSPLCLTSAPVLVGSGVVRASLHSWPLLPDLDVLWVVLCDSISPSLGFLLLACRWWLTSKQGLSSCLALLGYSFLLVTLCHLVLMLTNSRSVGDVTFKVFYETLHYKEWSI